MSWKMYRWVWRLEAPLYIGTTPAGQLNRTRLYVPARTLWGALTAELARKKASSSGGSPNYKGEGDKLREKTRLSYLFPAQPVDQDWIAWIPIYEFGKGLLWRREDRSREVKDREFRRWLLTTRMGTAIDPNSDTVSEGTLRENEVVNQWSFWGEKHGDFLPVLFSGYIFIFNDDDHDTLKRELETKTKELFIGGDTRYGLGRVRREYFEEIKDGIFFGIPVDLQKNNPEVRSDSVLAHASIATATSKMYGAWEMLVGWDNGELKKNDLVWVPGSRFYKERNESKDEPKWSIEKDGLWKKLS
ncbi:RAMP superfamily CRISPR-associated protein [Brockia lithotrophica]|uniref:CRISPR type III-associated protein domain-containing protein n=1 Tax=Brockia lithotrophica TaxID=933949 RepID=A0A660L1C2_9BACL|nr:RAMP superfamily CRISPR-associated protein [Brockia lithotrophica]RKQ84647.1 hypothetical protein C7438_1136 [Brockia lithotrophica]